MKIREQAKDYIKMGWSVIPLRKGTKLPAIPWNEYRERFMTPEEIDKYFNEDTNMAVVCGKLSGIMVVDQDFYKGDVDLKAFEGIDSPIKSITGRGGIHLYFKYSEGTQNTVNEKVKADIRSEGGYVVIPPSEVVLEDKKHGKYAWVSKPTPKSLSEDLPEAPESLLELLYGTESTTESSRLPKVAYSSILGMTEGGRNNEISRMSLSILSRGESEDNAWSLVQGLNQGFNPPLPENELRRTFESAVAKNEASPSLSKNEVALKQAPKEKSTSIKSLSTNDDLDGVIGELMAGQQKGVMTGIKFLDDTMGGLIPGQSYLMFADTSVGKCHGKGTLIRMFDGSLKKVEDIVIGDKVMGPDSKQRKVLSLARGSDEMYEISPRWTEPFVVNKEHILPLVKTGTKKEGVVNISVKDYLEKSESFKHRHRLFSAGVEYAEKKVSVDPYFLGLWLGDGDSLGVGVTTFDEETQNYLESYAKELGLQVTVINGRHSITCGQMGGDRDKFSLQSELRALGVIGNKHIPASYLINSKENRLKVLAGLIDSDGCLYGPSKLSYEVVTVNEDFAHQITDLARSLGFASKVVQRSQVTNFSNGKPCISYRVSIIGNCSEIPVLVKRKKVTKETTRTTSNSTFTIESKGLGDYYGFNLDGDHLYLLDSYLVQHNSMFAVNVLTNLALSGTETMYFDLENDMKMTMERMTFSFHSGKLTLADYRKVLGESPVKEEKLREIFAPVQEHAKKLHVWDLNKLIKRFGDVTWAGVKQCIEEELEKGKVKVIVIDHLHYFSPAETDHSILGEIARQINNIAAQYNVAILLVAHTKKGLLETNKKDDTVKAIRPTVDHISGSGMIGKHFKNIIALKRNTVANDPYDRSKTQLYVDKTKFGPAGSTEIFYCENTLIFSDDASDVVMVKAHQQFEDELAQMSSDTQLPVSKHEKPVTLGEVRKASEKKVTPKPVEVVTPEPPKMVYIKPVDTSYKEGENDEIEDIPF